MNFKFLYLIAIFTCFTFGAFTQNVKAWEILYKQSKTIKDKKEKILQITETANEDFAPLIFNILQEQVEFVPVNDAQEKKYYDEWVMNTVTIATRINVKNVSSMLKTLYQKVITPRYKGDIMVAMGKTQDKEIVDFINNELRVFNDLQKAGNIKGKEDIVDGVIRSLELLKEPSSFNYLFYAALPGYAEKTRNLAKSALNKITESPSSYCDEIIMNDPDMSIVLDALKFSYDSKSDAADKINSARFALQIGLDTFVSSEKNKAFITKDDIRDESVKYLGDLKATDKDIVTLIAKKWKMDKTTNSSLITIEALQKIATPESAKVLSDKLAEFNIKTREGAGTGFGKEEGERITLAIIKALGEIGEQVAVEELLKVKNSSRYGETIKKEAVKSLEKINKK